MAMNHFLTESTVFAGPITDKIFVATPNKVRAFNRKGKLFLSFDLSLTEPINSMYVLIV